MSDDEQRDTDTARTTREGAAPTTVGLIRSSFFVLFLLLSSSSKDFLGFAREFELLHKYVTQHDLKQIFSNVLRDMPNAGEGGPGEITNLTGGGLAAGGTGATSAMNVNSALEKAGKAAIKRAAGDFDGATGGSVGGPGDDDSKDGGPPAKELSYRQFLELLAAISFYVHRNPYYSLPNRVEKFILTVLAARKKLPTKIFRSAI